MSLLRRNSGTVSHHSLGFIFDGYHHRWESLNASIAKIQASHFHIGRNRFEQVTNILHMSKSGLPIAAANIMSLLHEEFHLNASPHSPSQLT
jgi:hypothetical protein